MKAIVRRTSEDSFAHEVSIRDHVVTVDEPRTQGGDDRGPNPQELLAASLASCTAITMEMYAKRKGWELDRVEVECEYEQGERGSDTSFDLLIRLPDTLTSDQMERLKFIAGKCPVHRTLAGSVRFSERVELLGTG